jgi:hypothetical protein
MFKDGRTNIHDEKRSGQASVVSDGLVQSVDRKICERRRFTFSELPYQFSQISRTVTYEIFPCPCTQLHRVLVEYILLTIIKFGTRAFK